MRYACLDTAAMCRLLLRNPMLRDSLDALIRIHRGDDGGSGLLDVVAEGVTSAKRQLLFIAADGAPSTSGAVHSMMRVQVAPGTCEVSLVHTAAAMRGRGVATRLMAFAIRKCRAMAGRSCQLTLEVDPTNLAAVRLYERAGFVVTDRRRHKMALALF